jgi:antirestriction protein
MAVTLTASYKETLKAETVELIDELLEDNYCLEDILVFIDEHSEEDFVTYYETYVEQGEKVGYEVVEAFIEEEGFCDLEHVEDAYVGTYASGADFAEELVEEQGGEIPSFVIVDYEETWAKNLSYDYTLVEKGYHNCYIFRKWY